MRHFILTGTPGAGKTAIIRQLDALGFPVVEEAATDVVALAHARGVSESDNVPAFIDDIVSLQERRRSVGDAASGEVIFHDRSPICTLALAEYVGVDAGASLAGSLAAIEREDFYARRVFFVRNLGFIVNTAARRISFEDTLRFERVHEDVYRRLGYDLVMIEPGPVLDRAKSIIDSVSVHGRKSFP